MTKTAPSLSTLFLSTLFLSALFLSALFLSALFLSALFLSTVYAVDVEPLRLELTGRPGEAVRGALIVRNPRREPVTVTVSTGDYRYGFTAQTVLPDDPNAQRLPSCRPWLTLMPETLTLAPGTEGEIGCTVTLPAQSADDPAGEYVAAVLVDEYPEKPRSREAETQRAGDGIITVVPRMAVPLYVLVAGRDTPQGRIAGLTASAGPGGGGATVRVLLILANDGQTHLRPSGTVLVVNARREVVYRSALGRMVPIFPQFQEGVPFLIPLSAGQYTAVATVDMGGPELLQQELAFTVMTDGHVEQQR